MIVGMCTVYNEAPLLAASLDHAYAQGVGFVLVACSTHSDDGSAEILAGYEREGRLAVLEDDDEFFDQPRWTTLMASMAHGLGASWVLPFDIDEFVCPRSAATVADALERCELNRVAMTVHAHRTPALRLVDPSPWIKVAWRAEPNARVHWGQHWVDLENDNGTDPDVLWMREYRYRDAAHYVAKVRTSQGRFSPEIKAAGAISWHYLRADIAGASDAELEARYESMYAGRTCLDPLTTGPAPVITPA